ncbi:phosphate-starvation-inducible PsiE family protein [Candidatus Protochlamydia phocaeensis]|uniref:phosphate-starvation-inducible PsiE family protein n=1 Tax=Candidatus Protochlamydia phocaeensis TaxID=1414722 RepID=UPI0009AEDC9A|nr:phosphate-starvation-inducible PsiE family protein [Candidatus Protochlamydia phocaeensis]
MQDDSDTNFPLEVKSPFINFLQKLLLFGLKILACLMALVIIWSILDVAFILYQKAKETPFLLINIDSLLEAFGGFLVVLIAIEIFLNIILYLRKDMGHLRLVIATALMAIARKIIILDYAHTSAFHMLAMGAIIVALGIAYWLINHAHRPLMPHYKKLENESNQKIEG